MNNYNQIAFFLVTLICVIYSAIKFKQASNPLRNRSIAIAWFSAMDVVSNNSRYKGVRSEILSEEVSRRIGFAGYEFIAYCKTKSGRFYFLRIVVNAGLVSEWEIIPDHEAQESNAATFVEPNNPT